MWKGLVGLVAGFTITYLALRSGGVYAQTQMHELVLPNGDTVYCWNYDDCTKAYSDFMEKIEQ